MRINRIGAAAAVSICALGSAHAANLVKNGSFEADALAGQRRAVDAVGITDWYAADPGALYPFAQLLALNAPGTADDPTAHFVGETVPPGYFTVYPGFPTVSPDGGNFIGADGDPWFHESLNQVVSGLVAGQRYSLSFYQAAAQQAGQLGPTTEQWQVTFGGDTQFSRMVSIPQAGVSPWEKQTMTFTASSSSQLLTSLAQGTPNGAPPISFLDGVSLLAVPEPATWALMIGGFGLIGTAMRKRQLGSVTFA